MEAQYVIMEQSHKSNIYILLVIIKIFLSRINNHLTIYTFSLLYNLDGLCFSKIEVYTFFYLNKIVRLHESDIYSLNLTLTTT